MSNTNERKIKMKKFELTNFYSESFTSFSENFRGLKNVRTFQVFFVIYRSL